jgi:hypothetical protein
MQLVICRSRGFAGIVTLLFQLVVHLDSPGWCENSTRLKSCKPVWTRSYGAWAWLAHGLQCLCDGRMFLAALSMEPEKGLSYLYIPVLVKQEFWSHHFSEKY